MMQDKMHQIVLVLFYESKAKKHKSTIKHLADNLLLCHKEKEKYESKVSKYWHRWRKSKKQIKELIEVNVEFDSFTNHLLKIIQIVKKEKFELTQKLSKFNRERDPITGKFKKKK